MNKQKNNYIIAFILGIIIASIPWYFHSKKIENQLDLIYLGVLNPDGTINTKKDSISFENILADEAIKNNKVIKSESNEIIDNALESLDNLVKDNKYDKLLDQTVPDFEYPDRNGKLIHIQNFRGKWVLIDVWASWCKPCMGDIELLNQLEKKYENNNIVFLGVSIDTENMKDKWINVLDKRNPSGIQILAGDKNKDFKQKFIIGTVPRYILIDPNGKIAEMNLPRPYNPEMEKIINDYIKKTK